MLSKGGAARTLALYGAAALVLILTRAAPSFDFLGPRGALFGWLGYVTLVTAGLPSAVMAATGRSSFAELGLTWGRARRDAPWIGLGLLASVAVAAVVARAPGMRAYYPRYALVKSEPLAWIPSTLAFAAYGLAWETLFRGFLLLGLASPPGAPERPALRERRSAALLVAQTLMFGLAHLDKPSLEAWLSLPAGLFFGVAALRTRSVLPGFLVHFTLSLSINLFCAYGPA